MHRQEACLQFLQHDAESNRDLNSAYEKQDFWLLKIGKIQILTTKKDNSYFRST